ncbi:MAG: 3-hydroxyacyl-CoA dehydrogenase family protein [Desulfobacterales bacterium]|nr:3-hydroxyacyl-CoA dehydrogenase family protein [Desulfobacterales bacterium]MDX2512404.1 3-hydroxyacyl-CoA dehydrogenase family protein [Desulfobacterales bacterium]
MKLKSIQQVTIIGAGRMGLGIGQEIATAGTPVSFYDIDTDQLAKLKPQIEDNLKRLVETRVITKSVVKPTMARITVSEVLKEAVNDADLVIEAVVENLELKKKIFKTLDRLCPEHTILASNTSSLMPGMLASVTQRVDRVLVAHYFYPAYLMPLVEIVRSEHTSEESVNTIFTFLKTMGKKPIVCQKEVPGFIANRLQIILEREAFHMVQRGIASAQDVDRAVKYSFGRRLGVAGPFEILEHNEGYDMTVACEKYILPDMDTSDESYPLILEMVKKNKIGLRSREGFYKWTPEFAEKWEKQMEKNLIGYL